MDESDEAELLAKAKGGDKVAFGDLWARQQPRLLNMCYRILRDSCAAEDAVMEGALRAWEHIVECQSSFGGWLYRITKNAALDMKRSAYTRHRAPLEDDTPSRMVLFEDLVLWGVHISNILDHLSEPEHEIFLLQYDDKFSTHEIAEILGISDQAARQRCSRATRKVRQMFNVSEQL